MLLQRRRRRAEKREKKQKRRREDVKIVSVRIDDVRHAVNEYARSLEKGISLRNIIGDNNEIDFELLYDYLGGLPDRPFYMSKETFEIFEDEEYPKYIDMCQVAVDQYVKATGEEPIVEGNPYNKVSYFKLQDFLPERPPFDLYLHPKDRMVTHRIPKDEY